MRLSKGLGVVIIYILIGMNRIEEMIMREDSHLFGLCYACNQADVDSIESVSLRSRLSRGVKRNLQIAFDSQLIVWSSKPTLQRTVVVQDGLDPCFFPDRAANLPSHASPLSTLSRWNSSSRSVQQ